LHRLITAAVTTGQKPQLLLFTRTDPLTHAHRHTEGAAIAKAEQRL
jgi:hypothetical protein